LRSLPSKRPERRQQFLKASAGRAGAQVIAAQLFEQLLVAVHHAVAASHLRLGGVSPSSAYCLFRKQGRLSKSSLRRMRHLLVLGGVGAAEGLRVCQTDAKKSLHRLVLAPSNNRMKLTIVLAPAPRDTEEGHSACSPFGEHRTLAAYPGCSTDVGGAHEA